MNIEFIFKQFRETYIEALKENGFSEEVAERNIQTLKALAIKELETPYEFAPFHEAIRAPFDYYRFGNDFFRPLIKLDQSKVVGKAVLETILGQLAKNENVILLANHQTEPDPQIISILLEKEHPELVEKMIFVAGHRVITDPVAIPFSKGRNLLCIHSKRYLEHPPELKEEKMLHNRRTLERMRELLQEGGKCIYVAPSGGRDRADSSGVALPAPFDPSSIELFNLASRGTTTHFYPFAMKTYDLLPPPDAVQKDLGEVRLAKSTPVHIAFAEEVDLDHFPGAPESKKERREARALYIWNIVRKEYQKL